MVKLYGALLGKEDEAERLFAEQAAYLDEAAGAENTGKTVAFFYISSSGYAVARKSGDYVTKMIELAGGNYVFKDLGDPASATSTVPLEMEQFYAAARDADYIIYNSTIGGELSSLGELIDKNGLLRDFRAVQNGNVWCTEKNLFQETTQFGLMISDIRRMLTEEDPDGLRFLYRRNDGAPRREEDENERGNDRRRLRYCVVLAAFAALFVALALLNIGVGSVSVGVREILGILFRGEGGETARGIIWKVRLPRAAAGVLLGGALSLSGFLLQTFFNNPIAGPYVLGISSGAKLTVAILMVLALSRYRSVGSAAMIAAAFAGAMLSMGFVLLMARAVRRSSMLIVSGVMIGYICSAVTDFIVAFADDASIVNLHNWSRGSFSGASWEDVR